MLGVSATLYEAIRYFNIPVVAGKITPEIYDRMKDFISAHTINGENNPPTPKHIPKEPYEIFVDNDVNNYKDLKLSGNSLDFVSSMVDLRKAMEPFFKLGYRIGVTLYKRDPNE